MKKTHTTDVSFFAKYRTRLLRLRGNLVKLFGYGFHALFPLKRFSLPSVESPTLLKKDGVKIPKKIWQTNFSEKCTLPMYLNFKHNRSLSSDFEYHYVSTEERDEYVKKHASKRIYSAFKRLTDGAAQADLWRLLVLYNEGGVYMDIDATLVKQLSLSLSTNEQVFIRNSGGFTNFFLATIPKSNLFLECLEKVVRNIENYDANENKTVFDVTGPGALLSILENHNLCYKPQQTISIQGAFTNEHFQYMDRPRSKWVYKKTFIE